MEQYPPELSYNNINPKGFFSTFKEWEIEPLGSGGVFWPGENVKILIQSIVSGVMDPYRSHLEFEVECDTSLLPVGLLQVDSSAQSFIEQLVISSKNREIERIPEYGVLAAWLTDIGLSEMYAEGREIEGLGYNNVENLAMMGKQHTSQSIVSQTSDHSTLNNRKYQNVPSLPTVFPTQNSGAFLTQSRMFDTNGLLWQSAKTTKGHIHPNNPMWQTATEPVWWTNKFPKEVDTDTALVERFGYVSNMRAEYVEAVQNLNFVDSTTSKPSYQINVKPSVMAGNSTAQWTTGLTYETYIPDGIEYDFPLYNENGGGYFKQDKIPNTTSMHGYSNLYSPNYCKGVREPFISPTVPQCQMRNGKILAEKIPIARKRFKIPLISAIMGLLIPEDQFVLIPIKAINEVLMEFVFDRYAMFTSGHNDINEFDTAGMAVQQLRAFSIKKVAYKMHTYQFYSEAMDEYLNKALLDRIVLNVNMWTLGNQYQIPRGDQVTNSWPVACTSEALNEIVVLFVPLDYVSHSFCRKHFRLSNNIQKFQLRINMDYYPSQAILGNGGNPMILDNEDNSPFIENIFWSNNFMFNHVNPWPRINPYNFAINERCYDISKKNTFYDKEMWGKSDYVWTQNSVNQDTALGMPNIHENRYVGKAGYVFSFEPYAHSAYHLTGLDCRQVRQFDVILSSTGKDYFPREQTMYIYTRSSVIVEFTANGINVYGR